LGIWTPTGRSSLSRKRILDRDGENLVDGVHLEVFDVPVSVRLLGLTLIGEWRR
jgi:hypothetical protein